MNILFTCAGRRTYLLKYFKEESRKVCASSIIYATDMQLDAPALMAADVRIQVPSVYDDRYMEMTLNICRRYDIDVLISLNDLELPLLAREREKFEMLGVKVIISSPEVIDTCFDKYATAHFIMSIGLRTPLTYVNIDKAKRALQEGKLSFPLVLKPRWGSGSIGIEFVENMKELQEMYVLLERKVNKSILAKASVCGEAILIQEKITGMEYGMDVMNNLRGEFKAVSVKRKLAMRAGETDKAVTVDNTEIRAIGKKLGDSLKHVGNLDCDVLEQDGKYYVLELNPRFGGGYPFSHEAGVNLPLAIINWVQGKEIDPRILEPRYGECYSKCDCLIEVSHDNTII